MKFRLFIPVFLFIVIFFCGLSRTLAAPIDLDGFVAGVKSTNTINEATVTTDDEEKDIFKKQEGVREQYLKTIKEKEQLTKNLNYLLLQAYKGKIDAIFGNLRDNIAEYPIEIQVRIFRQVSDSITTKMQVIEEKGASLGANRKEVLSGVLEYIKSLVNADIARVQKNK